MAQNKVEEHGSTAAGWCFVAAVLIPVATGIWLEWAGPWWAYVIAGVLLFMATLSGWVTGTQEREVHQAITEMNERQKAAERGDQ
ncbi:hypothetical protein [Billgrantia montanilacus]|uniref:Uncharacterized protein n=1 Tax=Billgrantia montanilacus TaxID=2282305 RepID=A0A368TT36_9GAMM|nr:hypothetical protein [Halomonas montanilacus]RCV87486.1 hypothetical protein DU505_17085 [Halomonas montanilacus]